MHIAIEKLLFPAIYVPFLKNKLNFHTWVSVNDTKWDPGFDLKVFISFHSEFKRDIAYLICHTSPCLDLR